jgi:hypothetical protein
VSRPARYAAAVRAIQGAQHAFSIDFSIDRHLVSKGGLERARLAARLEDARRNARLRYSPKLDGRMNPSINKRQKERDRQEHQRAKAELRRQRRDAKNSKIPTVPGEDPDIAGIVPGPQPPAEE